MPKTKKQKIEAVELGSRELALSNIAIIADFTGLTVNDVNTLRKSLKAAGIKFAVVKKRLLTFIFKSVGIEFDPKAFTGQTGVAFSPKDVLISSALIQGFAKKNQMLKIMGGFDLKSKAFIPAVDIQRYGNLPGREVLLGQLVYMLAYPIKSLLFVLNQKSKQTVDSK